MVFLTKLNLLPKPLIKVYLILVLKSETSYY
jgi:hypothetical protein